MNWARLLAIIVGAGVVTRAVASGVEAIELERFIASLNPNH
jgi:hypothetical protein